MSNIAILGSGMGGLGAAYRLHNEGITPVLYEKNFYPGGQTATLRYENGFLFDYGPHISFTKDLRIQELFADSVDHRYEKIQINLNNFWRGFWPKHPVQVHLHGLPEDVIVRVILDFVKELHAPDQPVKNYADWLLSSLGRSFAELFPMQYTRKYHLTTAENMSIDWLGPRIYRPSLEEVLRGALSPSSPHTHYITHFRYPMEGGFVSYLKKFVSLGRMNLNHELVSVDPRAKRLTFSNGQAADYDALISSVPLPDLVGMIKGVPKDVMDASRLLACSTCLLVNVGIDRATISDAHMTYFYDEDICFTRLSFPHMLSARNAPPGAGSIQAEIYFSDKYRPLTGSPDDWTERAITDLRRCGLLKENDSILLKDAVLMRYANIIFDLDRAAALETVHSYLDDVKIAYCGRYGDWGYLWTDESFISGENAAEKVIQQMIR